MAGSNIREVKHPEALRDLTSRVMVRTRRSSVAHIMELPPRKPQQPRIQLQPDEAAVYARTARFLRDLYKEGFCQPSAEEEAQDRRRKKARTGRGIFFLECIRLAQRLCSSAPALAASLQGMANGELVLPDFRRRARQLAEQAAAVRTYAKLEELTALLQGMEDPAVVFRDHLATVGLNPSHPVALRRVRARGTSADHSLS